MGDVVAHHRFADIGRDLLSCELGRVHANHDEFVWILLPESTQLRDIVVAVNSTEGPELQYDDLAAQRVERQWLGCIQPVQAHREFRGGLADD